MNPVRSLRALRAAMFAALCVLLAATGHLLMSGTAVPWWALAVALPGTAATAWALAGRERGLFTVTTAAVAVQAVLHTGFSLSQSLVRPAATTGSGQMSQPPGGAAIPETAGHVHHALHETADAATGMSGMTGGSLPGGMHEAAAMSPAGMLAAHLLAAVLCGLWLAHGERAAFRMVRAVAGRLWTPLRLLLRTAAPAHRPRPRIRRRRGHRAPRRLFLVHAITSRGPPTGTAVL
ncbi:hypothetical protein ACIPWI_00185 [Streptomyces sp. NPDC090046]|uniref:hypothetical protein n=2 Tax=unclassified Streptomyces TaxID=2593676 RepID=UPI003808B00D